MLKSAPRGLSLLFLLGCASPIPDSAKVFNDTGGLSVADGPCGDRTAIIGAAPVERVALELDCAAPSEDGVLKSCSEATLSMRDSKGGLVYLQGLTEFNVEMVLPDTVGGRTLMSVLPLDESGTLADGLLPELRMDLPTYLPHSSLQVVPEDDPASCNSNKGCAFMALDAVEPGAKKHAQKYPLGTPASGVFLLGGIGWDEDPVVLELEVPLFAPESLEATVCDDGLIHYTSRRQ